MVLPIVVLGLSRASLVSLIKTLAIRRSHQLTSMATRTNYYYCLNELEHIKRVRNRLPFQEDYSYGRYKTTDRNPVTGNRWEQAL